MKSGPLTGTQKPKAFVYLRVSTMRQAAEGVGLDSQEAKCRAHAQRLGLEIAEVFRDEGLSGKDSVEHRPGLAALLKAFRANSDAIVIVYSVSRLARRQSLLWHLLDERTGEGLAISSATENFDTTSPMGRAMLGMIAVWAQLEADMISERTKDALAVVKANGKVLGRQTLGQKYPELCTKVQAMYATGLFSHKALTDKLNAMGETPPNNSEKWTRTVVQRCLDAKIEAK